MKHLFPYLVMFAGLLMRRHPLSHSLLTTLAGEADPGNTLLLETGDDILQENGSYVLLES